MSFAAISCSHCRFSLREKRLKAESGGTTRVGKKLKRRRKPATLRRGASSCRRRGGQTRFTPGKDLSSWLAAVASGAATTGTSANEKSRRPGGFAESAFCGMKRDGDAVEYKKIRCLSSWQSGSDRRHLRRNAKSCFRGYAECLRLIDPSRSGIPKVWVVTIGGGSRADFS